MDRTVALPVPDYEAEDVLVVSAADGLRALADELRANIVTRLREHARSTTELAEELGIPKGTVGHHLKVLEKAGLVRVVRTRKVRAVTEMYYGRVARLFVLKPSTEDEELGLSITALSLRRAADEIGTTWDADRSTSAFVHVRLAPADARRLVRRLDAVVEEMRKREQPDGEPFALALALYRMADKA